MPDGIAIVWGVGCGFLVAWALSAIGTAVSRREPGLAAVAVLVALVWGTVAGLWILPAVPRLPPHSGLDRFLVILLPVTLAIEAEAAAGWLDGFWLTFERGIVALIAVPVLLHGSVWLSDNTPTAWVGLGGGALVLWAAWEGIASHVRGTGDRLVAAITVAAITSAGLAIMMAGWVRGGAVALTLAAALGGAVLVAHRSAPGRGGSQAGLVGLSAAGIVALFGLLVIGRFFGRLGSAPAALLLMAPLVAAIAAGLSRFAPDNPAAIVARSTRYRLLLAAVPLVAVLIAAKADFDTTMGRLMERAAAVIRP